MDTRSSSLLNREAHALAIGEHSIPAGRVGEIRKRFSDCGWKGHLSPLDPELSHNTAGVAGMARGPAKVFVIKAVTSDFQQLLSGGRVALFGLEIGLPVPILLVVVYGWTNGRHIPSIARRTDKLIQIVSEELDAQPGTLFLVAGDLNAEPAHLPNLAALIQTNAWFDVGAHGSIFGGQDSEPTCLGYNAELPTRNDFVFACPGIVPYISLFTVYKDLSVDVHSILRLTFKFRQTPFAANFDLVPPSFAD